MESGSSDNFAMQQRRNGVSAAVAIWRALPVGIKEAKRRGSGRPASVLKADCQGAIR